MVSGSSGASRSSATAASMICSRVARGGRPRRRGRWWSRRQGGRWALPSSGLCDRRTHKATQLRVLQSKRHTCPGGSGDRESSTSGRRVRIGILRCIRRARHVHGGHGGRRREAHRLGDRGHADRDPHRGDRRRGHTRSRPGAYAGARDAVQAFGKYINGQGGLAGRKVVVDFIDSKLNGDETRNAIIKACQNDFAVVGTGALFMNNVDDLVACPDKAGREDRPARRAGGDALGGRSRTRRCRSRSPRPSKVFSDPSGDTYQAPRRPLPVVPAARVEGSARHVPRGRRPAPR